MAQDKKKVRDELDNLLDRLERTDLDDEIEAVHSGDIAAELEVEIPERVTPPADLKSVPIDEIQHIVKSQPLPLLPSQPDANPAVAAAFELLTKIKSESDTIGNDIIGKWKSDNAQIEELVAILMTDVRASLENEKGLLTSPEHVIQGLVKLLEVKSNTSMVAVKLLEVRTKLLAALKSSNIIVGNVIGGQDADLAELLASPVESDI